MPSTTVTTRYARALFGLFDDVKAAQTALGDLELWAELLRDNPEFRGVMLHPEIGEDRKLELAARVQVCPEVRDFINLLITKKRVDVLDDVLIDFEELLNEARNAVAAEVISAVPLDEALLDEFELQVARLTGKNVRLENVVDPGVVGGIRLVIGDRVIDSTLTTKLSDVRRELIRG
jgi:F-type H+-transporting ATPase subunit delta